MSSLKANFDELMERVRHGRDLRHASFDPIYYLVFSPRQILEVKRTLPAWEAKLRKGGHQVHRFSIADAIAETLAAAPLRKIWIEAEKKAPMAWSRANQSLANALSSGAIQTRLLACLEQAQKDSNAIVLVTDLEALHPYTRIGAVEAQLYGKFQVPTVFFYPGERTGKTRLKFLGFYPEDGNYRSVHVGG